MVTTKNDEANAGGFLGEGKHLCVVDEIKVEDGQHGPQVHVTLKAIASDVPTEVGRTRTEWLSVDGRYVSCWWRFAIATGITTEAEFVKALETKAPVNHDETLAESRLLYVDVRNKKDKQTGETVYKKGFPETGIWDRFYAINSAIAKDFPPCPESHREFFDEQMKAMGGQPQPVGAGASNGGADTGDWPI